MFLATQPTQALIIHASVWSKQQDNGKIQRIYLFGDRHIQLKAEPTNMHETIIALTEKEQTDLIHYAKTLNAYVIVEDFADYNPQGAFSNFRKKLHSFNQKLSTYCCSILGLIEACKKNNISCSNAETRHDALLSEDLIRVLSLGVSMYIDTYFTSWLINWSLYPNNKVHKHLTSHWKKYLGLATLPLLGSIPTLYGSYQNYKTDLIKSKKSDIIKAHIDLLKKGYKIIFNPISNPALYLLGWQLDINVLTALEEQKETENIFVATGALHTLDTAHYLRENGYIQEILHEDPIAKLTNSQHINIANPLNISEFFENYLAKIG